MIYRPALFISADVLTGGRGRPMTAPIRREGLCPAGGGDKPSDRPEGDIDKRQHIVLRLRRSGTIVPLRGHNRSLRSHAVGAAIFRDSSSSAARPTRKPPDYAVGAAIGRPPEAPAFRNRHSERSDAAKRHGMSLRAQLSATIRDSPPGCRRYTRLRSRRIRFPRLAPVNLPCLQGTPTSRETGPNAGGGVHIDKQLLPSKAEVY